MNKTGIIFNEKEIMKELETKFSRRKMMQVYDKALISAGEVIKTAVKANLKYFRDTGAEYGEVKLSKPKWENGARSIRVYWEGPHHRYSIVHLNEKGFHDRSGKFVRPKGYGAIDKAIRSAKSTFYKVLEEEVEKLL